MSAPSLQIPPRKGATKVSVADTAHPGATWLFAAQIAVLFVITGAVVTRYWSDHLWLGWGLVAIATLLWAPELGRDRARRWWFVYVAGIFAYTLLRSYADETFIPTRTTYVIRLEELFPGPEPISALQPKFFDPGHIDWFDGAMVLVHWSFFVAPHLGAILVFLFRRELFPRYVTLMVGIMYAGLALFFLAPTTPPWLAAQEGHLGNVFRVMDFVGGNVDRDTYQSFYASLGEPNSVAAMPSIHMAATFALFLWVFDSARRWSWPLLAYSVLMGFALVYLAEHYITDELVGVACALGVFWLARKYVPPMRESEPQAARR
ncbi:MAG: phosphatase PAP2 family protein [Hyphomicrobiales bacterium]